MKFGAAAQPRKLRLIRMLMKREMELEEVAKRVRMPKGIVESLLKELVRDGLLVEEEGVYKVTKEGKKVLKNLS